MTDTNGNGNGSPWWVKAARELGVPSLIAIGLVYWMTQVQAPQLSAIEPMHGMLTAHVDASGKMNAEILFYLRSICVNFAETAEERTRCVPPR